MKKINLKDDGVNTNKIYVQYSDSDYFDIIFIFYYKNKGKYLVDTIDCLTNKMSTETREDFEDWLEYLKYEESDTFVTFEFSDYEEAMNYISKILTMRELID